MGRQCTGGHEHVWLPGGRAEEAERHLPALVTAVLRTLRKRLQRDHGVSLQAVETGVGTHMDEPDATQELSDPEPDSFAETKESFERPAV